MHATVVRFELRVIRPPKKLNQLTSLDIYLSVPSKPPVHGPPSPFMSLGSTFPTPPVAQYASAGKNNHSHGHPLHKGCQRRTLFHRKRKYSHGIRKTAAYIKGLGDMLRSWLTGSFWVIQNAIGFSYEPAGIHDVRRHQPYNEITKIYCRGCQRVDQSDQKCVKISKHLTEVWE